MKLIHAVEERSFASLRMTGKEDSETAQILRKPNEKPGYNRKSLFQRSQRGINLQLI